MRSSPTPLRRLGTSAVAGAALVAAGAVLLGVPALANHTASNGAVTSGPDLVFTDCASTSRTTARPEASPSPTNSTGTNPQAFSTGSGCTVQASTLKPYTLKARFTFNAQPVSGRVIRFQITGDTQDFPAPASSSSATLSSPQPAGPTTGSSSTTQFCTTNFNGECTVQVSKSTPGSVTVTGQERDSGETATETIQFRRNDSFVEGLDEVRRTVIMPAEDDYTGFNCEGTDEEPDFVGTGASGGCGVDGTRAPSGTPGRPVQVSYQLLDGGSGAGLIAEPGAGPRPLTNREITLTLSDNRFFFTPNCGPINGNPPAPGDYRRCSFRSGTSDGAPAGLLAKLPPSQTVTSDENGIVTVTVAVDDHAEFNFDGTASVVVQAALDPGRTDDDLNGSEGEPFNTAGDRPTAPLNFNTRNRPLNGITVRIEQIDTSSSTRLLASRTEPLPGPSGTSSSVVTGFRRTFRPITATELQTDQAANTSRRFEVFLQDQFTNLVRVPSTDVAVSATGPGVTLRRECTTAGTAPFGGNVCSDPAAANTNPASPGPQTNPPPMSTQENRTTGSYRPRRTAERPIVDYRHEDPFIASSTQNGPVTISATWQAPLTVFSGGGINVTSTPTASPTTGSPTPSASPTTASPTPSVSPTSASPTATPTPTATQTPTTPPQRFANRVVLSSSHSRITAGNAPTLNGQVFDQNGQPLSGVNVSILQKSFGQSFYSPTPSGRVTSGFDGRFSVVVRPINQTSYGANTDDGRARSNIVQIRVNARININSPRPGTVVFNPVTLSGNILPAYNNRLIGLRFINSRGSFPFVGQSPTRNGVYSVRSGQRFAPGTYTFIAYMSPTQGTDYGSKSIRLTVR